MLFGLRRGVGVAQARADRAAATSVPSTMPASIGPKRSTSARTPDPANSCHSLVTNDGNSMRELNALPRAEKALVRHLAGI
ncbi:hypothetical protein F6X40_34865 [Paraburkholderia sp. UCT31]|uniref:hypothetical protein n=1 Tax=Paraburkholderia sp. UCT31 TaxID=2615209 RepID=UPI00165565E6|nr:hypothetical protein [Paraburkholderia sp. UCT31]MBC8741743.1 hypothetical protein [Paraburkholderia sp. UCT31]